MTESKQDRLVRAATQEIAMAVTRELEAKKLLTALAKNCGSLRFPADATGEPPKGSGFRLDADVEAREWVLVYVSPEEVAAARDRDPMTWDAERLRAEVNKGTPGASDEFARRSAAPRIAVPETPRLRIVAS